MGPRCGVGILETVKLVTFGNLIEKFVQSMGETECDTREKDGRTDKVTFVYYIFCVRITRNCWFNFSV